MPAIATTVTKTIKKEVTFTLLPGKIMTVTNDGTGITDLQYTNDTGANLTVTITVNGKA